MATAIKAMYLKVENPEGQVVASIGDVPAIRADGHAHQTTTIEIELVEELSGRGVKQRNNLVIRRGDETCPVQAESEILRRGFMNPRNEFNLFILDVQQHDSMIV